MQQFRVISILLLITSLKAVGQQPRDKGLWIRISDTATGHYGYRNETNQIVIPIGKYECFTDTFRHYAIIFKEGAGFVGIDRQEHVLYSVFPFDNGPDDPANGVFRITAAGKIGYADAATGRVVIQPQFACAWPFEHGTAKVALECETRSDGEYHYWLSDHWFFINKHGVRVKHKPRKSP